MLFTQLRSSGEDLSLIKIDIRSLPSTERAHVMRSGIRPNTATGSLTRDADLFVSVTELYAGLWVLPIDANQARVKGPLRRWFRWQSGVALEGPWFFAPIYPYVHWKTLAADRHIGWGEELLSQMNRDIGSAVISPSRRWVLLFEDIERGGERLFLSALESGVPAERHTWKLVTDRPYHWSRIAGWSANGQFLYFVSIQDGKVLLLKRRFDPHAGAFVGASRTMYRFGVRDSRYYGLPGPFLGPVTLTGRILFQISEPTGNVWMLPRN